MKILFILLTVLLITAAITLLALNNPGYVMLGYGKTSLEMPLIDFLVLLAVVFLALYFVIRLLTMLRKTPKTLRGIRDHKQASKLQKGLTQGLLEMAEGNWSRAEKQLVNSAEKGDAGMLNYLAAAHSAQRLNNADRRDDYIRQASKLNPKAKVAVGLTQAELQIRGREYEEALATLQQLDDIAPRHPHVQKQLAKLQHQLGEWDNLMNMLPALSKNTIVTAEEYATLENDAVTGVLNQLSSQQDYAATDAVWKSLSKTAKVNPEIVASYASLLISRGQSDRAEPLIRKSLNSQWNDELVAIYGMMQLSQPKAALKQTEKWLPEHPDSAELLMATARLSAELKLWGQARSLYQESLNIKPQPRTYAYMAELLDAMGENDDAKNAYQMGLNLVANKL